jgi:Rieske Fe-S protein
MPELTDDTSTPVAATAGLTRRTALRVAAVSGAGAALLAACGGDGGSDTAGTDGSPTTEAEAPTADETGDGDTGGGSGGGAALVATAEVPVGGGVILEDQRVVVTQPAEGTFKAFSAVCTHQSCTVGSVKNGAITCPCHGSRYSAEDGSVQRGPAPRPLQEIPVAVEGDSVVRS